MAKGQKIRLFFSSMDIVIYAVLIFTAGIMVGFGIGRFKQMRFYYAEKRLDSLDTMLNGLTNTTAVIRQNVTMYVLPTRDVMVKREPSMNCAKNASPVSWAFTRNFTKAPDILFNIEGLKMNMVDSTTTQWMAKVEGIQNTTSVNMTAITPPEFGLRACYIALPGLEVK